MICSYSFEYATLNYGILGPARLLPADERAMLTAARACCPGQVGPAFTAQTALADAAHTVLHITDAVAGVKRGSEIRL